MEIKLSKIDRRTLLKAGVATAGVYAIGVSGVAMEVYAREKEVAREKRTSRALNNFESAVRGVKFTSNPQLDNELVRKVMVATAHVYGERFGLPVTFEPYGIPVGIGPRWGELMQPNIEEYPRASGELVRLMNGKYEVGTINFYVGNGKTLPDIDQDRAAVWTIVNQYVRRQVDMKIGDKKVGFGLRHFDRASMVQSGGILDGAAANLITNHLVGTAIEREALVASEGVYAPVINGLEMRGALWLREVLDRSGLTIGWLEQKRRTSDSVGFADEIIHRISLAGVRGSFYRSMLEGQRSWDVRTADDLMVISNQLRSRESWRRWFDRVFAK